MFPLFGQQEGYRSGDYSAPSGISVADLLRFERDELGNEELVAHLSLAQWDALEKVSARDALWVCRTAGDAERFAYFPEEDETWASQVVAHAFSDSAVVVVEDGDGGYLVLDV